MVLCFIMESNCPDRYGCRNKVKNRCCFWPNSPLWNFVLIGLGAFFIFIVLGWIFTILFTNSTSKADQFLPCPTLQPETLYLTCPQPSSLSQAWREMKLEFWDFR